MLLVVTWQSKNHSKGTERFKHENDRLSKPGLRWATKRGREMTKWWTEDFILGIAKSNLIFMLHLQNNAYRKDQPKEKMQTSLKIQTESEHKVHVSRMTHPSLRIKDWEKQIWIQAVCI